MKILFYGASVTAQKNDSGYVQVLLRDSMKYPEFEISKISYGGSNFNQAGFSFLPEIISLKPDIVFLDWLTPSALVFNDDKLKFFNETLLKNNIVPIWLNFPRKDDFCNSRQCYRQVKDSCSNYDIPFIDFTELLPEVKINPEAYLRDVVHTTELGAKSYAELILAYLLEVDLCKLKSLERVFSHNLYLLPKIISCNLNVTAQNYNSIEFEIPSDGSFEFLIEAKIGPKSGIVTCYLINEKDKVLKTVHKNTCDPWCYYEREMIMKIISDELSRGKYKLKMIVNPIDPFEFIELRDKNPECDIQHSNRKVDISRLIIVGSVNP